MRYINFDEIPDNFTDPSNGCQIDLCKWVEKSEELLEEMISAPDEVTRNKVIDDNSEHWGKIKPWLLHLSKGRCWYSDTADVFQHYHVEHFRPKKSPLGRPGEGGYWWLAFEWQNYRISGGVGNTRKGAYFPLVSGKKCSSPDDDIRYEIPQLIDPTNADDVALIDYNFEGELVPNPAFGDEEKNRVIASRDRYNLDYDALKQKRKLIWKECHRLSRKLLIERRKIAKDTSNIIARSEAKMIAGQIKLMVSGESELSEVAKAYIKSTKDATLLSLL